MEKKRILIADDDAAFLMGLAVRLVKHNFKVITAKSGDEALRKALRHRPDAIITDINMPCGDGFTLQGRLGSLGWDEPPIIYVTGEKSGRMETRLWQYNAREVFYKPLDTQELLRTIEDVLIAA
jgi:DNA-binding response OmpR family regulator